MKVIRRMKANSCVEIAETLEMIPLEEASSSSVTTAMESDFYEVESYSQSFLNSLYDLIVKRKFA